MAAGYDLFHNAGFRGSEIFCGIKNLLGRRDVVVRPSQQINRALDIVEIERAPQPDKLALSQ